MEFRKRADLTGQRFGKLVVQSLGLVSGSKVKWNCLCDCGGNCMPLTNSLRSGNTTSCGCKKAEVNIARARTHGMCTTSTYTSWRNMKRRCNVEHDVAYPHYGGRGIKVCERWDKFDNFFADMGEKPNGMGIERRDNDKGYSPDNCYWATSKEQARNRRVTLKFEGVPLSQIAEESGINYWTLLSRFRTHGTPFPKGHNEKR